MPLAATSRQARSSSPDRRRARITPSSHAPGLRARLDGRIQWLLRWGYCEVDAERIAKWLYRRELIGRLDSTERGRERLARLVGRSFIREVDKDPTHPNKAFQAAANIYARPPRHAGGKPRIAQRHLQQIRDIAVQGMRDRMQHNRRELTELGRDLAEARRHLPDRPPKVASPREHRAQPLRRRGSRRAGSGSRAGPSSADDPPDESDSSGVSPFPQGAGR